jgi:hypothetical protein
MNILITAVRTVLKRPFIIVFFGILMLFFTILNNYNPLLPIIFGLSNMTGESVFESMVSLLQVILNPGLIPEIILFLLGFALVASLIAGVVFSGYMYIIGKTLDKSEKVAGDFIAGLKKYFLRVFLTTLKVVLVSFFLVIFMMIVCVPAIVVTRVAMTDKPELMPAALFIDFLTAAVLFFGFMFSRAYIFFWYPAIFKNDTKPFTAGKRFVDANFWTILGRLLIFDVVFAVFQYIIFVTGNSVLKFILSWLFGTVFIVALIIYIFSFFNENSRTAQNRPDSTDI